MNLRNSSQSGAQYNRACGAVGEAMSLLKDNLNISPASYWLYDLRYVT